MSTKNCFLIKCIINTKNVGENRKNKMKRTLKDNDKAVQIINRKAKCFGLDCLHVDFVLWPGLIRAVTVVKL